MSDKELIEQLAKEHLSADEHGLYYEGGLTHLEAFAKAYVQTQGKSEWIPVQSGNLPLNGDMVFGYGYWEGEINGRSKDMCVEYGEWDDGIIRINGDAYTAELVDITHWLPYELPEAPKP